MELSHTYSRFRSFWEHNSGIEVVNLGCRLSWHSAMSHMHMMRVPESSVYDQESWLMYMWLKDIKTLCSASECVCPFSCCSSNKVITQTLTLTPLRCFTPTPSTSKFQRKTWNWQFIDAEWILTQSPFSNPSWRCQPPLDLPLGPQQVPWRVWWR
jgi:hypothetical protein